MAGRRTATRVPVTLVQPPGVDDPNTQRALEAIKQAVQDLQSQARPLVLAGSGSPEGRVAAPAGALYLRNDGGAGATLYVKETGTGPDGWAAK